jgi:hypothetical protein
MRSVDLTQYQTRVGNEHVGSWTPFAGVVEGGVGCADCVWLLGERCTDAEFNLTILQ